MAAKMRRKVAKKIEIAPDLELHVSTVKVAGQVLVEIRNFIPSSKTYGRGITAPMTAALSIKGGIEDAHQDDRDERRDALRSERLKA